MTNKRAFDLVIWGATGFTGKLVAEYLATRAREEPLRWAIAGRNPSKLDLVRSELQRLNAKGAPSAVIIADSMDRASLEAMVEQTNVICSMVGPFALYGDALVDACVARGTHYCDSWNDTH